VFDAGGGLSGHGIGVLGKSCDLCKRMAFATVVIIATILVWNCHLIHETSD
jgi:hypothetical protein